MTMFQFPAEEEKLYHSYMESFGNAHVEDLFPKGYKKYGLNKFRWVPIDFGLSHYVLPEMPIMDYIMIAANLEEHITKDSVFDVTAFYQLLASRNILILLNRAYSLNAEVKQYYDISLKYAISSLENNTYIIEANQLSDLPDLLRHFSLSQYDTIKKITDTIISAIEPITMFYDFKNTTCTKITKGTDEERNILYGYKLYYLIFPLSFSLQPQGSFSCKYLNDKYHSTRFSDEFENTFINRIRKQNRKEPCYENSI